MKTNDLIDRQAAIDAMANTLWHYPNECYRNLGTYEFAKALAELGIKSLPSAQPDVPETNVGKWLKEDRGGVEYTAVCSECGYGTFWSEAETYNFCPMCGSDMRGDKDE